MADDSSASVEGSSPHPDNQTLPTREPAQSYERLFFRDSAEAAAVLNKFNLEAFSDAIKQDTPEAQQAIAAALKLSQLPFREPAQSYEKIFTNPVGDDAEAQHAQLIRELANAGATTTSTQTEQPATPQVQAQPSPAPAPSTTNGPVT